MEMIPDANPMARHEPARAAAANPAQDAKHADGGEFLTFKLGAQEYGIDILRVQEIRSYEPPTRIANAASFVKGVVNLRGVIVPIVDLRLKLNCERAEYDELTVVIVLEVKGRVIGAVVDSVCDVLELAQHQVQPAAAPRGAVDTGFVTGIGSVKNAPGDDCSERLLMLMDIEGLMSSAEMGLISAH